MEKTSLHMNLGNMNENDPSLTGDSVYLPHARTKEQALLMEDIADRGICFMCPEHIPEFYESRDGLIAEGEHSYLVHNGIPYENTDHHLMVLPKEHITRLQDASDEFILEAFDFFRSLEASLEVEGGAVAMRFGKPELTGATASHLHIHFIVPRADLTNKDEPVRFRMSKKPE